MKGCKGIGGGGTTARESASPTAYEKRISAEKRHMGGRELAPNECLKRGSLAQLRKARGN